MAALAHLLPLLLLISPWLVYRAAVALLGVRLAWRPPPRAWLEVSIPQAVDVDSTAAMSTWWARVVHAARGSRLRGRGQIELLHVVVGATDAQPTVRTYIACDPAVVGDVRREIKQQYGGAASIVKTTDPLAGAADHARALLRTRLPRRSGVTA